MVAVVSRVFDNAGTRKLFQWVLCFCLLFGFFGFRDITVLNDTPHYYGTYYHLSQYNSYLHSSVFGFSPALKFEWGYQVLMHILIKYVSRNPYTIILFSSFIFTWGNIWMITRFTDKVALSAFILCISGVWLDQFSLIRQTIALLFFYKAYFLLKKDRWGLYVLLILLGTLFHTSALTLLILPLLKCMKTSKQNVAIVLSITVLIACSIYYLLGLLGFAEHLYLKISMQRQTAPIAAILNSLLMISLISAIFFYYHQNKTKMNRTDFWLCIFSICVCIVTLVFLPLFRINVYTWPILYMILLTCLVDEKPNIVLTPRKRAFRNSSIALLSAVLLVRITVIITVKEEWYHVLPYSFYDFSDRYHYYNLYLQKER
ncbi:MAG: EpsG family protein [Segatella maculosa]